MPDVLKVNCCHARCPKAEVGGFGVTMNQGLRNYSHPKGIYITLSGNPGDDAKPYQEKQVREKIEETKR